MMIVRTRGGRGARWGTVTSIGGVAGTAIRGTRIFISGTAGNTTEGITRWRVPIVPGRISFESGFFSGVSVTVRTLRSRTIVSDTSPVSFLLKPRVISPGEETFSPSTAVM